MEQLLALPLSVGIFMAETFQGSLVCLYFTLFFGESWLGTAHLWPGYSQTDAHFWPGVLPN